MSSHPLLSDTVHRPIPTIWTFIAADCASFAMFFMVFMSERASQVALFDQSARTLDLWLGLANTIILISSSFVVALANESARAGDLRKMRRRLWAGTLIASLFGGVKTWEYVAKISHGITPLTNDFFTYYFILTGVHFFHYVIGMGVLIALSTAAGRRVEVDRKFNDLVQWGGLYWHMVDLLWVFLFSMLYLIGDG
jgi:nitric oxide reductase NorE protein